MTKYKQFPKMILDMKPGLNHEEAYAAYVAYASAVAYAATATATAYTSAYASAVAYAYLYYDNTISRSLLENMFKRLVLNGLSVQELKNKVLVR